ncbi:homocysteine S-methyltransferase family protein [Sphingopyxis sp. JAI128]|uniref:homocysteine S-methyltransferase family protein n=1 Tax=Sphingopyxis sp. JAI128 TaxID=2723066 RepID=UPI00160DDE31|nr:homocysteine S-methyltransferase family protein [Sphingopyxis sp. JAI128]MBB6428134.1 S-methylmethionine-dependent homocysteine/selenocysteine methylase [Sphingopyxis sp. JAI128]
MAISSLPQLDRFFLTDAGLETDILFNKGIDLPLFSSVTLFTSDESLDVLETYYRGFLDLARAKGTGLILESATWRASPDWAEPLGFSPSELDGLNGAAIDLLRGLRAEYADVPVVISGCLGPRGDGYDPGRVMTADESRTYHAHQAGVLAAAGVDMLAAITMTNVPEAVGVANAAKAIGLPVAISFTVETDGRLPTGETLGDAIAAVDAATGSYPAYYMINCAHPTHFEGALDDGAAWTARIGGVRANASCLSHAELDAMTELDIGDPADLAARHRALVDRFPQIKVVGGCCGTDLRHVTAIAEACLA